MKKFAKLLLVGLSFILSACVDDISPQRFPKLSFGESETYKVNVASVNIDFSVAQSSDKEIELGFPVTIQEALKSWVDDRIETVGSSGSLRIMVTSAHIKYSSLQKPTSGIRGTFTDDQTEQVEAFLEASFEIYDEDPTFPSMQAEARVNRTITLREKATLAERKQIYYNLVKNLLNSFDQEAEVSITQYLGPVLTSN